MNIHLGQSYSFRQLGQRENQEDSRYPDTDLPEPGQRFFVVCDGVGGSEKGEVASSLVCRAIGRYLSHVNLEDTDFDRAMFSGMLDYAYDALDNAANDDNRDMATTMTFVCLHKTGCLMAHIGDSRIYHVRPGEGIMYRSDDHSLVNSLVHSGVITPEEAVNHPQRNVITRYMGPVEEDQTRCLATVTQTSDIQAGDYFFLCSDGVLHCITDDELVELLESDTADSEKFAVLSRKCVNSTDNNTAILVPVLSVIADSGGESVTSSGMESSSTQRIPQGNRMTSSDVASIQDKPRHGVAGAFRKLIDRFYR